MPVDAAHHAAVSHCVTFLAAALLHYSRHSDALPACDCVTLAASRLHTLLATLHCSTAACIQRILTSTALLARPYILSNELEPLPCVTPTSTLPLLNATVVDLDCVPSRLLNACDWTSTSLVPFLATLSSQFKFITCGDILRISAAVSHTFLVTHAQRLLEEVTLQVGVFNAIREAEALCDCACQPQLELCTCSAPPAAHALKTVAFALRVAPSPRLQVALASAVSSRVTSTAVATSTLLQVVLMLQRLNSVLDTTACMQLLSRYAAHRADLSHVASNACVTPDGPTPEVHADFIAGRDAAAIALSTLARSSMHTWGPDTVATGSGSARQRGVLGAAAAVPRCDGARRATVHGKRCAALTAAVRQLALSEGGVARHVLQALGRDTWDDSVLETLALMRLEGGETVAHIVALEVPPRPRATGGVWMPQRLHEGCTLGSTSTSTGGDALDTLTRMLSSRSRGGAAGGVLALLNAYSATVASRWCSSRAGDWAVDEETVERFRARFPGHAHTLARTDIQLHDVGDGRRLQLAAMAGVECDVIPTSDAYWPPGMYSPKDAGVYVSSPGVVLHPALESLVAPLCQAYATARTPRYLSRKRLRGVVELQIENSSSGDTSVIKCTLLQALVMLHVADATHATPVTAVAATCGVADVSRPISFWIAHGYFKYVRGEDGALCVRACAAGAEEEPGEGEEGAAAAVAAAVEVGDDPAAVTLWRAYVVNMLTAMGALPLARVHNMMHMFASGGPHTYDKTEVQCSRFLADMARDGVVELVDGVYRVRAG